LDYQLLPVYQHKDAILNALKDNQVIVVESPTGSGKTTQIPLILHEAGYSANGIIGVTQPRRIAALSVSEFIARQIGEKLGETVGYKMRFEDTTGLNSKIKIMTDGILLQEMKLDPWLSKYSVMMVDEAHERSLNIDFILGLLKRALASRPDFKVIISSATINAAVFADYFTPPQAGGETSFPPPLAGGARGGVPLVQINAETYPVTLIYDPVPQSKGKTDYEALNTKIESIIARQKKDCLVFLPGERAIKDCMERLVMGRLEKKLFVLPLYGRLGKEEQERVFQKTPKGKIKVVIATNIAETSVTIDGIGTVIDSGLVKMNYYNPRTYTSSLIEEYISKAAAKQRRGRAGRTGPGLCYRLYTRSDYESRPEYTTEEIFRSDLAEVVLRMADLGIDSFDDFDFISNPGREGFVAAVETLKMLDALEGHGHEYSLTNIGKMMTAFPLQPRHSRIIVEAIMHYPEVIEQAVIAASFLSTQSPYILPPGQEIEARQAHHRFRDARGDFISYLKLFAAYKAAPLKGKFCEKNFLDERAMAEIENVDAQLEDIVNKIGSTIQGGNLNDGRVLDNYLRCVAKGLLQFVCVKAGREIYRSLTEERILIHPGSVMFKESPEYIVAGEIVRTTRMYAMSVSPLSETMVKELCPALVNGRGKNKEKAEGREGRKGRQERPKKRESRREIIEKLKQKKVLKGWADIKKKEFRVDTNLEELISNLDWLLQPVQSKGKEGFACLRTDSYGAYFFRPTKKFWTAVNESISTLESLFDDMDYNIDIGMRQVINEAYRKLRELSGT
jgi:RNA helicase HrpA